MRAEVTLSLIRVRWLVEEAVCFFDTPRRDRPFYCMDELPPSALFASDRLKRSVYVNSPEFGHASIPASCDCECRLY